MDDRLTAAGSDWPAPAKINLFLHVTGRRADGYHTLQTAFQFLDLCDRLDFALRDDGRILRHGGLPGVAPEDDLVVRAARSLQRFAPPGAGADIRVDKRIPAGGGLGGGSSDAATVLVALNRLWRLGLGAGRLAALALELGADVPVFAGGRAAWAEGVGELLTPIDAPQRWVLVLEPDCRVATAEVFADPQLTRDTAPMTMADLLAGRGRNDCEAVVRRRFPAVGEALDWLGRFAPARLTGTGACVFATFESRARASEVAERLPRRWRGYVTRTLNRSPLLARLDRT